MACIVKNARLQGIFDLVSSLIYDKDSGINSYDDIINYFKKNYPSITETEINQAIMPLDELKVKDMVENLKMKKDRINKLDGAVNRLNNILELKTKERSKAIPEPEVKEINDLIKQILSFANVDVSIPPEAYGNIISSVENLMVLYDAYFDLKGPISESHIKRALEHAREIKRNARLDKIKEKEKELDEQIKKLKSGEITFEDLANIDTPIRVKGIDKEIAIAELALQEKKVDWEVQLRKAKTKAKINRGIFGYNGTIPKTINSIYYGITDNVWEPARALKFMADISAWGVQAAPIVYNMLTTVDIKTAMETGTWHDAFADQKALARIFYNTVGRIWYDSVVNSDRLGRKTKGVLAKEMFLNIKRDPLYPIAKKAGLQISEVGSLTRSEEVFTSNLINKVPGLGFIKDFSEATMASTLNELRWLKFKKYYEMTGGVASPEQLREIAEFINQLTGTTGGGSTAAMAFPFLSKVMSAPKLLMSRLYLMKRAKDVLISPDIASGLKGGAFFRTQADAFIAREYGKMVMGYGIATFLASMIPGVDFDEDPYSLNFLRYRYGDVAIDATGGIGTLVRAAQKAWFIGVGVPEGASYTTKEKIDYMKNIQKKNMLAPLLQALVENKLHPAASGAKSIISGTDYFGDRYNYISDSAWGSRLEAALRAGMPISFETAMDDIYNAYEVYKQGGDLSKDLKEATLSSILQSVGFNTFRYDNLSADPIVTKFKDKMETRVNPEYPVEIQNENGDWTKKYYRSKYRKLHGDMLGEAVISLSESEKEITPEQFKQINKKINREATKKFREQYGDALKEKGLTERGAKLEKRREKIEEKRKR